MDLGVAENRVDFSSCARRIFRIFWTRKNYVLRLSERVPPVRRVREERARRVGAGGLSWQDTGLSLEGVNRAALFGTRGRGLVDLDIVRINVPPRLTTPPRQPRV